MSVDTPQLKPAGDSAVVVEFGDEIDPAINHRVHALARVLASGPLDGLIETVPTYRSLLIRYDPLVLDYNVVLRWVRTRLAQAQAAESFQTRRVEVPTIYGGERGPDLEWVAQQCNVSQDEVIRIHSRTEYTVYMMGFTPGYPYLGTVDSAIAVPRLESPRTLVRAGSVGIAGPQTGIYPIDSPGGWRIIGWTPLVLFDPAREQPFLFQPGDAVRFVPTVG